MGFKAMGKLSKLFLKIVVAVVAFAAGAVLIAPWVIDPNDYKEEIAAEVKRRTGRDLEITGEIRLSFLPWLGLRFEGGRLSNTPGFGSEPIVAVDFAQIRVKPLPLFEKRLELDTIRLQGLVVNLIRDKDGRSNWADLADRGDQASEGEEPSRDAGPGPERALAVLAVSGLDIEGAHILWDDQASGRRVDLQAVDIASGVLQPGVPAEVQASARVESSAPAFSGQMQLKGILEIDRRLTQLTIADLAATISEIVVGEHQGTLKLEGDISADLEARRVGTSDLEVQGQIRGGALPEKGIELAVAGVLGLDLQRQTLALESLDLASGSLRVKGTLFGAGLATDPVLHGKLELVKTDVRQWLQAQGLAIPETADPEALRNLAATLTLRTTREELDVENLRVSVDGSHLDGELHVVGLTEHPYTTFKLRVDSIDADRYLPPVRRNERVPDMAEASAPAPASGAMVAPILPSELVRRLNADGTLRIGELVLGGLRMQDVALDLHGKDGKSGLDVEAGRFYEGRLRGWSGVDATGAVPLISVEHRIERARIGSLLRDLTGKDQVTGVARIETRLKGRGESADELTRTLAGTLDIQVKNGSVKGIDLARTLREAKALYKGKPLPPTDAPLQTSFSEVSATARIEDGLLQNRDLLGRSSWLRVTGEGQIDLVGHVVDYTLVPMVVRAEQGQEGADLKDLQGVPVPVHIKGEWDHPDLKIDWKTALSALPSDDLDRKIDQKVDSYLEGRVDDRLKDQVKGFLKGWLR